MPQPIPQTVKSLTGHLQIKLGMFRRVTVFVEEKVETVQPWLDRNAEYKVLKSFVQWREATDKELVSISHSTCKLTNRS